MQALKLRLTGQYYDSYVYSGHLYLWKLNGSILTLEWDRMIDDLVEQLPSHLKFAAHCAFRDSEHLYRVEWRLLFEDSEIKTVLISRFEELRAYLDERELAVDKYIIDEQDNPLDYPHSDTVFHYRKMYVCGSGGLFQASPGRISRAAQLDDTPLLSMSVSHQLLIAAAGSEGIMQYELTPDKRREIRSTPIRQNYFSNYVRWSFPSYFSSSYSTGFLADYSLYRPRKRNKRKNPDIERFYRKLEQLISSDKIFAQTPTVSSLVWGAFDKLCLATSERIQVVKYIPSNAMYSQQLFSLGSIPLDSIETDDIVSADSALFGYILEYDDGIIVVDSDQNLHQFPEPPVNWRVFPNARKYGNQLHIILEDHICILSFNNDYFVTQAQKVAGIDRNSYERMNLYQGEYDDSQQLLQ